MARWLIFVACLMAAFLLAITLPSIDDRPRYITLNNTERLILHAEGKGVKAGQTKRFVLKDPSGNIAAHTPAYHFQAQAFSSCLSGDCYLFIYNGRAPWAQFVYKITPDTSDTRKQDIHTASSSAYGLSEAAAKDFLFQSLYIPLFQAKAFLLLCAFYGVIFCLPIPQAFGGTIFNHLIVHRLKLGFVNELTTLQTGGLTGFLLSLGLVIGCGYEGLPVILALAVLSPLLLLALWQTVRRSRFD